MQEAEIKTRRRTSEVDAEVDADYYIVTVRLCMFFYCLF